MPTLTAVLLYFTGTLLSVKTMIRERGNTPYHRTSVIYHVLTLGVAAFLTIPIATIPALLLVRASVPSRYRLTPKQVSITETVVSTVGFITAVAA